MLTIRKLLEERKKTVAILYGRMNPPTKGHEENVNGLKALAAKNNADHKVIASRSHDASKNPLSPETKEKHLKRAFPNTHIEMADKQHPTLLHHATKAHSEGYKNLIVTGGGDRANEYHHLLHKYNGVEGRHGYYKFDNISVHSTGERKKGVSGTDMRNHVKNGDYNSFKRNLPTAIQKNDSHSKELYNDVRKGMGLHENAIRGLFSAIFVSGGPGSGKDIIIREAIADYRAVEIDLNYLQSLLDNKYRLTETTSDQRDFGLKNRYPLIINCTADKSEQIFKLKEELEELGYDTLMIFVETSNDISRERNQNLRRPLDETMRQYKWKTSQFNKYEFYNKFENFLLFKNEDELVTESELGEITESVTEFLDRTDGTEEAYKWIRRNLVENNAPVIQMQRKAGKKDSVKDGDVKSNSDYIFKTYESSQPKLLKGRQPKVPNFQQDNNTKKLRKMKFTPSKPGTIRAPGVGPTFDNRSAQGNIYPTSGLGNDVVYKEDLNKYSQELAEGTVKKSFSNFRKKVNEVAGTDPDAVMGSNMGVGGTLGGAMNKMPLQTPKDQLKQLGAYSDSKNKKKKESK